MQTDDARPGALGGSAMGIAEGMPPELARHGPLMGMANNGVSHVRHAGRTATWPRSLGSCVVRMSGFR